MSELSNRQKRYLLLQKRHHLIVNLSRLLILILFLGLWEITSRLGMIDSFVFSSPAKIVRCFWSMVLDRSIFHHLGITLYETILSFLFVTGISILIAVILWYSKKLSEILDPYLVVLNSLPKSALAPLLIVWLGANQTTIIIRNTGSLSGRVEQSSEIRPGTASYRLARSKPDNHYYCRNVRCDLWKHFKSVHQFHNNR